MQSAAIAALARMPAGRAAATLIAGWKGYSPALKSQALDALLSRPAGQLALGRLYFEGVGIQRDLVEAYKWMYLAGRGTAKAFQYINVIGNMLTYDQMSEAMRRGQMWVPTTRH